MVISSAFGGVQRTLPSTGILLPPKRPIVEAIAYVTRGIAKARSIVAHERPMEVVEGGLSRVGERRLKSSSCN